MKLLPFVIALLLVAGCAGKSQGPVLYPNQHLKAVGEERAQADIADCSRLAEAYVKANPNAKVVKGVIVGGAGGAAVGAAVGAVTGGLGRGALVGGVAGATAGLVRGAYKSSKPTPVYKAFVNRCLTERGYEPIGWEE